MEASLQRTGDVWHAFVAGLPQVGASRRRAVQQHDGHAVLRGTRCLCGRNAGAG